MSDAEALGLSNVERHVLLAVAREPAHGYAIRDAVETESQGTLKPRAGSLYRVIARLMARGYVAEVAAPAEAPPHPGRERRYYDLTQSGRQALNEEARRLEEVAALALERLRTSR